MAGPTGKVRVLVVDDDASFRHSLSERLSLRGYEVMEAVDGAVAVRMLRSEPTIDVVILDKNMPQMDGPTTLKEMKVFRPEVPVIILTGYGSTDSALKVGKLGVFRYLNKPVPIEKLNRVLQAAAREKRHARARLDMPAERRQHHWRMRLLGSRNLRPAVIMLGILILLVAGMIPLPSTLEQLMEEPKTGQFQQDVIAGHPAYGTMVVGETLGDHYFHEYRPPGMTRENQEAFLGRRALLMVAMTLVAALFWATGAVPTGITALVVAVVMYLSGVMRPDGIAQAFAKDAVVFIFGVLVLSQCIVTTGLDRRLAMLLLRPVRNLVLLMFGFLPVLAITCSFISESILIALLMPIFLRVHQDMGKSTGVDGGAEVDRQRLVMFALMLCFVSNVGGPGSPAAGGRNAVMIGILADYGLAPSFLEWVKYGLPFVPVAAIVVGLYFYLVIGRRLPNRRWEISSLVRQSSQHLGPMNREEKYTALVFGLVVILWILASERLGMGGPVLMGLVLLNLLGVMKWAKVARIHWELVFLYAGACALGKGMAETGGALFVARSVVGLVPEAWQHSGPEAFAGGAILPMAVSLFSGLVTNIMSDGATVAALGPIAVPMARDAGLHPWLLGFSTAFASSFPHMLIIGTPANALVYILCKDPKTGRQLVTQKDFLKHGFFVFVLSFIVLWGWALLGYWRWFGLY